VVDTLVDRLRADVLSGRYPPGSYLPPERELAAAYQVTRTSLKHAIVRLAQAGLVETRHGVGTRVRDYERLGGPELLPMLVSTAGPEWMAEIFQVRREVGALVAAQAAAHAGPEHRERLRLLAGELRTADGAQTAQLTECEIHRVIAAATGNRVYGFLVNALLNAYMEVRETFAHAFADPVAAADRIAPLVEALCAGDPGRAHAAATAYLDATEAVMLGRRS
jgi:DNA-binding FadR family transcriptional regulator